MSRPSFLIFGAVFFAAMGAFLYFTIKSNRYARDFDRVEMGQSENEVVNLMGPPSHREGSGEIYSRYASTPCMRRCRARIWWEAPILKGIEAWSVELDQDGRAIQKDHWVSP